MKLIFTPAFENELEIYLKKCSFLSKTIELLNRYIKNGKLHTSPSKTIAAFYFLQPCNRKDLQSFLGLAGYFCKIILNFAIVVQSFPDLSKKYLTLNLVLTKRKQDFMNLNLLYVLNLHSVLIIKKVPQKFTQMLASTVMNISFFKNLSPIIAYSLFITLIKKM